MEPENPIVSYQTQDRQTQKCVSEEVGLRKFGEAISATMAEDITIPFSDIAIVAVFPHSTEL
ncbi:MAG: hypothetical protein ACOYJG_10240 [Prevotella sp.]|jgi:hypothetical protein